MSKRTLLRPRRIFVVPAVCVALAACTNTPETAQRTIAPSATQDAQRARARLTQANSYADVVDRSAPAVVTVRSERRVRAPRQYPFLLDPFLERLFGDRSARQPAPDRAVVGLGSGVIFDAGGYALTNHHVIDGAENIVVELRDRRSFSAKLVGSDPPSDLAVLRIDARDLPTLPLANSDEVRVGDIALAIGNPLGIGQTVTMGIVSAKGRSTGLSDGSFEDFLQTDAPINQGNSGGALVDTSGELIGINSQIMSPSGGNIGIGFAIPSNMARDVSLQIIRNGQVRRGRLGIAVEPLTAQRANELGLAGVAGVLVSQVERGAPAYRAGLRPGDVITALNGVRVEDANAFRNRISGTAPGNEVTLSVRRGRTDTEVRATLGEFKARP